MSKGMVMATDSVAHAYHDLLKFYTHKYRSGIVMCLEGNQHMKSGIGKSYTAIRTGEIMDKDYLAYDGDKKTRAIQKIAWSPKDFKRAMNEIEKKQIYGQVVVVDEAGILVNRKKWYSFINQAISDTVMTMRQLRGIAIFVSPSVWKIEKDIREYVTLLGTCSKFIKEGGSVGVELDMRMCFWDDQRNRLFKYHPKMYVQDQKRIAQFAGFYPSMPVNQKLLDDYEEQATGYKQKVRKIIEDMGAEELDVKDIIDEVLAEPERYLRDTKFGKRVTQNTLRFKFKISADFASYVAPIVNDKLEEKGIMGENKEQEKGDKKDAKPNVQSAEHVNV